MQKVPSERFTDAVRRDPLFAAEGMDIERAEVACRALEKECGNLGRVFAESSFVRKLFVTRYPVSRYVVPMSFLRSFIAAERERRKFLAEPTFPHAQRLVASWRFAARELSRGISRYETMHRLLLRFEKASRSSQYQDMLGNVSTLDLVDETLRLLFKNAKQLEAEAALRARLLAGEAVAIPEAPAASELSFVQGSLSPVHTRLHELDQLHGIPFRYSDILETYGPIRYTLSQFDGTQTPHDFFLYIVKDRRTGIESIKVSVGDLFLFLPIGGPNARYGKIGRSSFEFLIARGARYWYQSVGNLYTSRDQRYWADIATIVDLRRRKELDPAQLQKQRSSMLDLMLGAGADDMRGYVGHMAERIEQGDLAGQSAFFTVLRRSHPSLYYLPFNRSVWRLPQTPNFLGSSRASPEDMAYIREDAVIQDTTPAEFEEVMKCGRIREEARRAAYPGREF